MSDLAKHYFQLLGIAKNWALKNMAGWCEETHRDLLARHGAREIEGRISATSMNMPQLAAALEDYERRGWPRNRKFSGANKQARTIPPRIAMMVRLWGKLGQAGKVHKASRHALLAFCARQTARNVPDLDALTPEECVSISAALKGWLGRETAI